MRRKVNKIADVTAIEKLVVKAGPDFKRKLQELISANDAEVINNDKDFTEQIIPILKLSFETSARGLTKPVTSFNDNFELAMLHLRDELIVTDDFGLSLARDFDDRLSEILMENFDKSSQELV